MAFRPLIPAALLLALSFNLAQAEDSYQTVDFTYHAKGGFVAKTLKELSSDEIKVAVNTACTYFTGAPCPVIADTSQQLKRSLFHPITNNGPNEFAGAFRTPDGSKMCRATVLSYELSQHATFNGTIQQNNRQLAYYAFVAGSASGPDDITAKVVFQIIPEGDQRSGCLHDGSAWLCGEKAYKSHECAAVQPGTFKQ